MESLDSSLVGEKTFFSTEEIKGYLSETAKWGKFLAIMGYIGIGLMVLAAIFVMGMGSASQLFQASGMDMSFIGIIYLVLAAFYFFPVNYLYQFSVKTRQALASQDVQHVTAAFQNLKSLFKFMGIFTIVILSIYALALLIALVAGMM
jgi:hypothetical protein